MASMAGSQRSMRASSIFVGAGTGEAAAAGAGAAATGAESLESEQPAPSNASNAAEPANENFFMEPSRLVGLPAGRLSVHRHGWRRTNRQQQTGPRLRGAAVSTRANLPLGV